MTGRRFIPGRLVVATHNAGKLTEILQLLGSYGVEPVAAGDLGLPEPEEDGPTFIANAEIKAVAAATATKLPALADDSGIVVESLDGAPRHLYRTMGRARAGFFPGDAPNRR